MKNKFISGFIFIIMMLVLTSCGNKTYKVEFTDYDGSILDTQIIKEGNSATAPDNPNNKEGYHFINWDIEFTKVESDLIVTALYEINKYEVKFVDYDGSLIEVQTVEHGKDATEPSDFTSKEGYHFVRWDKNFKKVKQDLIITAQYETNEYIVKFIVDDVLFYEDYIQHGDLLTYKYFDPQKSDYFFIGWCDNEELLGDYIVRDDYIVNSDLTFYAKFIIDDSILDNFFKPYLNVLLINDIDLPTQFKNFNISYESSNEKLLSNEGLLNRDYVPTDITLEVFISDGKIEASKTYELSIEGYKPLDKVIRSSYIYRSYHLLDNDHFKILDIMNTAFATADKNGDFPYSSNANYFNSVNTFVMPQAKKEGVWVVMSIAPDSSWSAIAASPKARKNFASNIVSLINEHGFDGVDIDWETPKSGEESYYVELMKEVYTKVKENNPYHLVTTAITAGPYQPPRYNLSTSKQYVDYINLMAYGLISHDGMYQNALYGSVTYNNKEFNVGKSLHLVSIDETVKMFNKNYNISNSQIIVGVAFYGIRQVLSDNKWVNYGSITYDEIHNNVRSGHYIEYYDDVVKVPYAIRHDGKEFVSYDNPRSIRDKASYIIENDLAGIMYWEHHHDKNKRLIFAIKQYVIKD